MAGIQLLPQSSLMMRTVYQGNCCQKIRVHQTSVKSGLTLPLPQWFLFHKATKEPCHSVSQTFGTTWKISINQNSEKPLPGFHQPQDHCKPWTHIIYFIYHNLHTFQFYFYFYFGLETEEADDDMIMTLSSQCCSVVTTTVVIRGGDLSNETSKIFKLNH